MSDKKPDQAELRRHLIDILRKFDTAILVTRHGGADLHGRPLAIASVEDSGDIYFATSVESPKVAEIASDSRVFITLQSRGQFATITGEATLSQDRAAIGRLWSEAWRVWFPGGKDDPSICLIRVNVHQAEYWDRGGAKGLAFVFRALAAVAQGRTPKVGKDMNAKVG
jgi:general stress protein 26